MDLYVRLLKYARPYMGRLIVALFCIVCASGANLYVPWIIKDVIDEVLTAKNMYMLNLIAIGIVVIYVLRGIFFYGQTYLMAYVGQKVIIDIREAVFRQLQRLSLSYFERRQTGVVMSYITNDVGALQSALVESLIELVTESVVLIGSIATMFYIDWELSIFTFITLPLVAHAMKIFGAKLRGASHNLQEKAADITAVLQEAISSIRVIKSFVREDFEVDRFNRENHHNFRAQMKTAQIMATITPIIEFLAAIGVTVIIWYGGRKVISGELTSGALIAFLIYVVNISNPIKRISKVYGNIQRAMAAAQRVFDVLDTQPDIQNAPGAVTLPQLEGRVVFDRVSFAYHTGEPALIDVSMDVQPGQMIAIVGPSGAGKTTIASLIPRFYDVTEGKILVDGHDVREVTYQSLREQIGIVPQETVLFNGTIEENIRYGKLDATREEIIAAAQAANAHSFIMEMAENYATHIGERGCKLSGGQRQRISIARAILKNPRVLILDEATSALDTESEKLVQEALDKLMVGRTSFVIAHRLSTVQRADMILVMERGQIIEQGSHQELIQANGLYHKLYNVQFRSEASYLPEE